MNITMDELNKIVSELKLMNTMATLMPESERSIVLKEGDKIALGKVNLSHELQNLKDSINGVLNTINDLANEIYIDAVNGRESFPENSMAKRALWFDEIQGAAEMLRSESREEEKYEEFDL